MENQEKKIIEVNWEAFQRSKKHMVALFAIGFFAIVGFATFAGALVKSIF